jgi:DNA-binding GntR family transcriptional regulator
LLVAEIVCDRCDRLLSTIWSMALRYGFGESRGELMADRATHRSLSRAVYAGLRTDILAGRYAPGAKLSPRAIATEYKVSLSVVREALTRLTEQDLVVAEPQLGFSVVELDIEEVRDISQLRILIEGSGLRQAIENADVEYEARVMASHHRLSRARYITGHAGETVTDEWAQAHADYHRELLSACPSPRLRDLAASLRDTAELYRRWSGSFDVNQEPRDVPAEHRGLMDAVFDHDPDRAVALLTDHINKTASLLESYMESGDRAEPDAGPAAS